MEAAIEAGAEDVETDDEGFLIKTSATALGTAICAVMTIILFGEGRAGDLMAAATLWLAYAMVFIVLMTFLSAVFASRGGACGVGIGVYALLPLASMWSPTAKYSPAGLISAASQSLTPGEPAVFWPLFTAALLAIALAAAAVWAFQRKEL